MMNTIGYMEDNVTCKIKSVYVNIVTVYLLVHCYNYGNVTLTRNYS